MLRHDASIWMALCLATITAFAVSGCRDVASETKEEGNDLPKEPVPVRAVKAKRASLKPSIDLVGSVVAIPERSTAISPQVAGWIQKVMVVEGDRVQAGNEVLRLDERPAEADLAKAMASVDEKTAIVERLKRGPRPEEIEMARHDAHKSQVAVEALRGEANALKALRANNEVSPVQLQKIQSALQAAEAEQASAAAKLRLLEAGTRKEEVAEAEARLAGAKAERTTAKLNSRLCRVVSPIDGIVTQLSARQGMYVERTAALATVVDLTNVFMQIRVPSAYLVKVKVGAKVDVRAASLPEKTYHGTIARISGQADPGTGDVDALVLVANEDGVLRPGLAGRSRIWLPDIADAIVVPVAAIADRSGTPVVSVVREAKSYEVAVKLGTQTQEYVQIVEGIAPGEWVITEGGYGLPEGCPVEVLPEGTPSR
jgi:multidrug efflux pump subunit AcrA (membrane-fusion protein)